MVISRLCAPIENRSTVWHHTPVQWETNYEITILSDFPVCAIVRPRGWLYGYRLVIHPYAYVCTLYIRRQIWRTGSIGRSLWDIHHDLCELEATKISVYLRPYVVNLQELPMATLTSLMCQYVVYIKVTMKYAVASAN